MSKANKKVKKDDKKDNKKNVKNDEMKEDDNDNKNNKNNNNKNDKKDNKKNDKKGDQNGKRSGRRKSQLSKEEYNQLKEAFDFFDKDGNGAISTDEIGSVLKTLGLEIKEQELEDIMADLDENGDGIMDFDEFVIMMDRRMSINSQRNEIAETFKVFDKDKDGKITFDDLKKVLTELGEDVSDKDVSDMIKEADKNGDGVIDFEEFMQMMCSNESDDTKNALLGI